MAKGSVSRSLSDINGEISKIEKSSRAAAKEGDKLKQALTIDSKNVALQDAYFSSLKNQLDIANQKVEKLKEKAKKLSEDPVKNAEALSQTNRQLTLAESNAKKLKESMGGFRNSIEKTNKEADKLAKKEKWAGLRNGISSVTTAMVALGVAAIAAVKGINSLASSAASAGQEIYSLGEKYGVAAEEAQRLAYAYETITGDSGAYSSLLKQANEQLALAAKNTNETRKALANLGLTLEDVKGLSASDFLGLVTEQLEKVEDETQRTVLATALFHEAGTNLAAAINSGNLDEYANSLSSTALLTDEEVQASHELSLTLEQQDRQFTKIKVQLATALLPLIQQLANIVVAIAPALQTVAEWIGNMSEGGQQFLAVLLAVATTLPVIAAAIKVLNTVMNANPIFLIVSAVATLIFLISTLYDLLHKNVDSNYSEMAYSAMYAGGAADRATDTINNYNSSNSSTTVNNNITISASNMSSDELADSLASRFGVLAHQVN